MSLKIYILADFLEIFFPARNFCRPVDLPEVKKNHIFGLFSHSIQKEANFDEKQKKFVFLKI